MATIALTLLVATRVSISCGFKHHLVGGIAQLRPQQESEFDRLAKRYGGIEVDPDLGGGQPGRQTMLGSAAHRFVLHCERHARDGQDASVSLRFPLAAIEHLLPSLFPQA